MGKFKDKLVKMFGGYTNADLTAKATEANKLGYETGVADTLGAPRTYPSRSELTTHIEGSSLIKADGPKVPRLFEVQTELGELAVRGADLTHRAREAARKVDEYKNNAVGLYKDTLQTVDNHAKDIALRNQLLDTELKSAHLAHARIEKTTNELEAELDALAGPLGLSFKTRAYPTEEKK